MKKQLLKFIIGSIILNTIFIAAPVYASTLDDLNQQKQDLKNSINSNQKQINNLQDMISSLDAQTAAAQKQIDLTNQTINLTTRQINETQAQIEQKQKELDQKHADLGETMRTFYETGNPSTLEIIVGSNNLSDMINNSQYMQSLSDQITNQANQITQAKNDLQNKSNDLENQKKDLVNQKNSLTDEQRNLKIQADAKNKLLSQTNNEQNQLKGELDNVSAAIYAERQKLGGFTSGGTGGYPWAGASTDGVDPWGFYYRQCTSYAAWYFNAVEGKSWYSWRRLGVDRSSNGGDWADGLAQYQGYSVSSTPREGAIASWPAGGLNAYGHVAIVQSVNADGTIDVSEFNWIPYSYDERHNVSPNGARFIY